MKQTEYYAELAKEIDARETELVTRIHNTLITEGMAVFVRWATAFPKRELRFVSGMGTATFGCPSMDRSLLRELDDYCASLRSDVNYGLSPRAMVMVQPMVDYFEFFFSFESLYPYPALPDIIYNPITRTVECGNEIIYLDK